MKKNIAITPDIHIVLPTSERTLCIFGCFEEKKTNTEETKLIQNNNGNFILYVSNQSAETYIPQVEIGFFLDFAGRRIIWYNVPF